MSDSLYSYHAFNIAVYGEGDLFDPVVSFLRKDERLAEAGICCRRSIEDFVQLVARHQDIVAAVVIWSSGDAEALLEFVVRLRRRQMNPLMPIVVRSVFALSDGMRSRLRANGIHGPCYREGLDATALVDDLLYAVEAMHEKQALVALSEFANDKGSLLSLPELAAAALAFLHRNGIGELGGLFCFLRPTSRPDWVAVAGTGRFGAADCEMLDKFGDEVRDRIEYTAGGDGEAEDADYLVMRLVTPEGSQAAIYLLQKTPVTPWQRIIMRVFSNRLAMVVDEILLKRRLERMHHATIATLATLSEYKDVDTGNHVSRVSRLTTEVAQLLAERGVVMVEDLPSLRHIGHASILHDIGKVGVPDKILLKPGVLDADERRIIERHTAIGHEILQKTATLADSPLLMKLAADVARSHHERFDGKGYPDGLAGTAIPLAARIVAVVDVFDALTSARPYKAPWSEEKAVDFICSQAGFHFDPQVVEAFLIVLERKKEAMTVTWSAEFSVAHEELDEDHKKLFGILNQVWVAKEAGSRQIVEMVLDDLMHYTLDHFRREEAYMESFGYPDAAAHRATHDSFAARIESLRWEYLHGLRQDVHFDLLDYLGEWLMNHIAHADMRYSRFCAGQGADPQSRQRLALDAV